MGSILAVLDGQGQKRGDWQEALRPFLVVDNGEQPADHVVEVTPPAMLPLAEYRLLEAPLTCRGQHYGWLALAIPQNARSQRGVASRVLLPFIAEYLALLLRSEGDAPLPTRTEPPTDSTWLSNFADLAYGVAHEFNNVLNNILLQLAVWELKEQANGVTHPEMAAVRQMTSQAAGMVRQLQQLSRKQQPPFQPLDLNELICEVLAPVCQDGGSRPAGAGLPAVRLALVPDLPPVQGNVPDLKRLVRLLLEYAAAASGSAVITVRTDHSAGRLRLRVEDSGPQVVPAALAHLFEPFSAGRGESDGWRLAVCKAVTRRLRGNLQGANRPEGGMAFTVDLPPAT
jgi:two-component system C4-dicarboxylate transport sensor histidine kinase DctB